MEALNWSPYARLGSRKEEDWLAVMCLVLAERLRGS